MGKSGVLERKSGNISETRKDRGKDRPTMQGIGITHQRSFELYHPDPYDVTPNLRLGVRNPYPLPKTLM